MQFRSEGKAVLYVTHRLSEVIRLADRITVLRDGKRVGLFLRGEVSRADIVQLMTKDVAAAGHPMRRQGLRPYAIARWRYQRTRIQIRELIVRTKIYASEPNCLVRPDRRYRRRSRLGSRPFSARGCRRRCSRPPARSSRRASTAVGIGATCGAAGNFAGSGRSSRSGDCYLSLGARQSLSRRSGSPIGPSLWASMAARRARDGAVLHQSSQCSAALCRHANWCAKRRQSTKDRDRPRT